MIFYQGGNYPGHWHPFATRCGVIRSSGTFCNLGAGHEGEHAHLTGPKYGECTAVWDNEREWRDIVVGKDRGR